MRKKKIICCLLLFSFLLLICSCNTSLPKDEMPNIGVPQEQINKDIELSAPQKQNSFRAGNNITILIKVISSNQVWFPRNFGAKIFIYQNNQWIEIPNTDIYEYLPLEGFRYIPFDNNVFNLGVAVVNPDIQNIRKATKVRIFLIGSIYHNGKVTEEKSAGYVDVNIWP